MLSRFLPVAIILSAVPTGFAQSSPSGPPKPIPSFDLNAIDKSIDPCVDFYRYACGNWMKNNPVPPDKSRWGRFDELYDSNIYILRDLLVQTQQPGQHSATEKMVGDFYASCMDEATIESKGTAPLKPQLARINNVNSRADLIKEVAYLHQNG